MLYNGVITHMEQMIQQRLPKYKKKNRILDPCEICNLSEIVECCNKCGTSVCGNDNCGLSFPHYGNTTFTICIWCANIIHKKLIPYIDVDKLRLLKQRIRDGISPRKAILH